MTTKPLFLRAVFTALSLALGSATMTSPVQADYPYQQLAPGYIWGPNGMPMWQPGLAFPNNFPMVAAYEVGKWNAAPGWQFLRDSNGNIMTSPTTNLPIVVLVVAPAPPRIVVVGPSGQSAGADRPPITHSPKATPNQDQVLKDITNMALSEGAVIAARLELAKVIKQGGHPTERMIAEIALGTALGVRDNVFTAAITSIFSEFAIGMSAHDTGKIKDLVLSGLDGNLRISVPELVRLITSNCPDLQSPPEYMAKFVMMLVSAVHDKLSTNAVPDKPSTP